MGRTSRAATITLIYCWRHARPGTARSSAALAQGLLAVALLVLAAATPARELRSYAQVQDDGSLSIDRKKVWLYGIYMPETWRKCRTYVSPVRCASRAVLALDFKVQGFVSCDPQSENRDGSLNAICYVNRGPFDSGEDLAAYLVTQGWALALPHAPFEYHALERIARHNNRGVWGFPADAWR